MNLGALGAVVARAEIAAIFAALGQGEARLVGGAVRDALLGIPVKDIDLATALSPYEVMRRCGASGLRTIPTGIAHGTVTALSHGESVEITTLRADLTTDGRHASVAFTDDWREDAARRDFTVNALYFDPETGVVSDWFGGLDDLRDGRVRFIGEPLQRIAEDHLRILRFFRFTARFGRTIDEAGLEACATRANDLMALSRERIADEWLKILGLPDPRTTVALMLERGILRPVLPEVEDTALPRLSALIEAERTSGIAPEALRRFAALLAPDPMIADKVAARLKLSNRARKRLASAADGQVAGGPKALAYRIGLEEAQDRLLLAGHAEDAGGLVGWTVPKLPLGGGKLIALGMAPGPRVAAALKKIESRWVAENFPGSERVDQLAAEELASSAS
jgi:poly(A) polymerase